MGGKVVCIFNMIGGEFDGVRGEGCEEVLGEDGFGYGG